MAKDELPPLLTFPFEINLHAQLFEQEPLRITEIFLQCFDEEGVQRFQVPPHVLGALAQRFQVLMRRESNSLDEAFGGTIARQRNRILTDRRDYSVVWDHMQAREDAAKRPRYGRGGTPSDLADEQVAERHRTSPDNVKRIYKKAGRTR